MAAYSSFGGSEGENSGEMRERIHEMMGPGYVDQMVRHAVQTCWTALPKEKRSVDELRRQLTRLIDRAIRDIEEDKEAFEM